MTPRTSDVLIIGAGIAGASTAYELARRGLDVRVLDKNDAASGQSGRNWGFVRRQGCDPAEIELVSCAADRWAQLAADIGPGLSLVRDGLLNTATSTEGVDRYRQWLDATGAGERFGSQLVSSDEIRDLVPSLRGDWAGGLYTPTDGHADPSTATRAIASAAAHAGASVETGVTVLGLEVEGGRVRGVRTTQGIRSAGTVVVAAGAWSSHLLRSAGLDLPVRWVRATAGRTEPVANSVTTLAVGTPFVGFSQRADGSIVFGTAAWSDYDLSLESLRHIRLFLPNYLRNWKMFQLHVNGYLFEDLARRIPGSRRRRNVYAWPRIDEPPPNRRKIRAAHSHLLRLVADLGRPAIASVWSGIVDVTPDALPVLGRPDGVEGLVLATGLSSHGFGIGPGVGLIAASAVVNEDPPINIRPFRLERFRSGEVRSHEHL